MKKRCVILSFLALVLLLVFGTVFQPIDTHAAVKNGWVKKSGKWYYYDNNKKLKNRWVHYKNKYYYLKPGNGVMAENEFITSTSDNNTYYLGKDGEMATGWKKIKRKWYYFKKKNPEGAMRTGWLTEKNAYGGKNKYYLNKKTGVMYADKLFKVGKKYYYATSSGNLYVGWKTIDNKKYYFTQTGTYTGWKKIAGKRYYFEDNGYVKTGWLSYKGKKYYLSKTKASRGAAVTGTQVISGRTYCFGSTGALEYEVKEPEASIGKPGEAHTIKNYLLGALQPVGNTLYVWGGGWAQPTATYIGIYPEWRNWFNSKGSSYDYSKYMDLSVTTRAKGLDCSGFVGWTTYQVMQTKSGVGYGYVAEASTIASVYASWGYGTLKSQAELSKNNYKNQFKPGDVVSMSGHTFIVLGQCSDGSFVMVNSTPPCVQINGTATPSGDWNSEAIVLARSYMNQYYSNLMKKFNLSCAVGTSYIRASNALRWNARTLADPDGYKTKTASQILEDLFRNSVQ